MHSIWFSVSFRASFSFPFLLFQPKIIMIISDKRLFANAHSKLFYFVSLYTNNMDTLCKAVFSKCMGSKTYEHWITWKPVQKFKAKWGKENSMLWFMKLIMWSHFPWWRFSKNWEWFIKIENSCIICEVIQIWEYSCKWWKSSKNINDFEKK